MCLGDFFGLYVEAGLSLQGWQRTTVDNIPGPVLHSLLVTDKGEEFPRKESRIEDLVFLILKWEGFLLGKRSFNWHSFMVFKQ